MENQIAEILEKVSLPSSWQRQWLKKMAKEEMMERHLQKRRVERIEKELEAINKKQNFLLDSFLDGVLDSDTYKKKKRTF